MLVKQQNKGKFSITTLPPFEDQQSPSAQDNCLVHASVNQPDQIHIQHPQ